MARDVLFIMGGDYSGTKLLFAFSACMGAMLVSLALVAFFSPVKVIREGRKLNLLMVASMFLPFFGDFTHRYLPFLSGISLSCFSFSITAWIILQNYWGYLYHSRRIAAQVTSSHYMVFDTHGMCTDINTRAFNFFRAYMETTKIAPRPSSRPLLRDLSEISGIPVDFLLTRDRLEFEFEKRFYRIQGFPVRRGLVRANGRSFLITDLTKYKVRENSLAITANHDALTQVYNRRFLTSYFAQLANRRPGMDISFLMIDADRFKEVNDTYGHLAGDEVLKTVARRIQGCLRTNDVICRFGGDEFFVLLSGALSEGMEIVARRILHAVSENPFVFVLPRTSRGLMTMEEINIEMTVSIGGYSTVLKADADLDVLLRCADAAMYCAKKAGRNRLVFVNAKGEMIWETTCTAAQPSPGCI
jgi:diguanylate cyclase (GGDEF)-like protein